MKTLIWGKCNPSTIRQTKRRRVQRKTLQSTCHELTSRCRLMQHHRPCETLTGSISLPQVSRSWSTLVKASKWINQQLSVNIPTNQLLINSSVKLDELTLRSLNRTLRRLWIVPWKTRWESMIGARRLPESRQWRRVLFVMRSTSFILDLMTHMSCPNLRWRGSDRWLCKNSLEMHLT